MKKKLIVKQVDESDCGACSLLSIIRYYGGNIPLEILKIDTNTGSNGTNALELINASIKYGFEGKGLKLNNLNNIKLPVIAHLLLENEIYHFVVIYEFKNNELLIMDPAIGKRKLKINDFNKIWTGNILVFEPITEITYLKSNPTLINLIKLFFKQNKNNIIKLYLIEIFLIFLIIINSFNFKLININIYFFTIIFFICLVLESTLKVIKNKLLINIKLLFNLKLNINFFKHLISLPLKYIQLKSNGEILTRFNELNIISEFIINILFKNIIELVIILFLLSIITIINKNILFFIIIFTITTILLSYIFNLIIKPKINKELNNEVLFTENLNEYINNIETIKVLNKNNYFNNKFNINLKEKIVNSIKFEKLLLYESLIKDIFISFAYLLLIFYCSIKKINLINVITLLNLTNIYFETLKSLLNDIPYYNFHKNIFIKINEFLNVDCEEKISTTPINYSITFNNVVYSYNKIKKLTYNFTIHENSFVMIKGKNGCGKSTLCKLLTKVLSNYSGEIVIGEENIKDYNELEIRNLISYSNQSAKLFKGTIKENIILDNKIDEEKFSLIKKICDLESVVKDKSNRYNSIIYENSTNFSGGEIQKIILARTLYLDKKIIILDETLSALNINSEIKIIKNIKKYLKEKTIIYITHKNLEKYFDDCIELERN